MSRYLKKYSLDFHGKALYISIKISFRFQIRSLQLIDHSHLFHSKYPSPSLPEWIQMG